MTFVLFLLGITAVQCAAALVLAKCFKYVDSVDAIAYAMNSETN